MHRLASTRALATAFALLPLLTAACRDPGEVNYNCTDIAIAGLLVDVVDSTSGLKVGKDARIVARLGTLTDSSPTPPTSVNDGPFGLAYEARGTFTLTVDKAGYRSWARTGIVVTGDQCHVKTVNVTAKLQR